MTADNEDGDMAEREGDRKESAAGATEQASLETRLESARWCLSLLPCRLAKDAWDELLLRFLTPEEVQSLPDEDRAPPPRNRRSKRRGAGKRSGEAPTSRRSGEQPLAKVRRSLIRLHEYQTARV